MSSGIRLHVAPPQESPFIHDSQLPVTLGRDSSCQVRLTGDSGVSRFHCRLDMNNDHLRILDLCSANGTFLNDERVSERVLTGGDEIRCGQTTIKVEAVPAVPVESRDTVLMRPSITKAGDPLPDAVGKFQIVRELGRGGMGRVLLGIDRRTRTPVAIKIVREEHIPASVALSLFVREAAILSKLKHPRIIEMREFGLHEGRPFFVMEYVPTVNLDEILAGSSAIRRIRIACKTVARTLEGLEYAYGLGYVHRDVKPSNLLAYYDSSIQKLRVKVADFGLAKSFETAGMSGLTTSNEVRGTLAFTAPEQILDSRTVGPSSDIYSCGATLYRLLSGQPPFVTRSASETMGAILNEEPLPIEELVSDLPASIAQIVRKAMAKSLASRFETASSFRDALLASIPNG